MRSLVAELDTNSDGLFLSNARVSIHEEKFILLGKAFLSALAVAEAEDLEVICSRLLPHKVTFTRAPGAFIPGWQNTQASQNMSLTPPMHTEGCEPCDTIITDSNPSLSSPSLANPSQPLTEPHCDQDLFATYTTLDDVYPNNASQADVESRNICNDEEMQDYAEAPVPTPIRVYSPSSAPREEAEEISSMRAPAEAIPLANSNARDVLPPTPSNLSARPRVSSSTSQLNSTQSTSSSPQSIFAKAFSILTSTYGEHTPEPLTAETIIEVIQIGDNFMREDLGSFIESFRLAWSQNGFWDRPPLVDPTRGATVIEKLFNGFCCAEILEQGSTVDPVRLRIARIGIYHYYEQLCIDARSDSNLLSRRSRGRDTASVATDKILEDMYATQKEQNDPRIWKRRRDSLQKHKKIGKRWSMLVSHLGLGILLTCHPSLGTKT